MVYISLIFIDSAQLVGFWSYFANLLAATGLVLFSTLSSTIAIRSFMAGIFEVLVSTSSPAWTFPIRQPRRLTLRRLIFYSLFFQNNAPMLFRPIYTVQLVAFPLISTQYSICFYLSLVDQYIQCKCGQTILTQGFQFFSVQSTTNQVTGHPSLDQITLMCDLGRPRGLRKRGLVPSFLLSWSSGRGVDLPPSPCFTQ